MSFPPSSGISTSDRYLAAFVDWMRELLGWCAVYRDGLVPAPSVPTVFEPASEAPRFLASYFFGGSDRRAGDAHVKRPQLPPHSPPRPQRPTVLAELELAEPGLPINVIRTHFGLTDFERDVLLLAATAELHTGIGPLAASVHGDDHQAWPTFALAMLLFEDPDWGATSPERPLRYWRLIDVDDPTRGLLSRPLRISERILQALKGLSGLDERLCSYVEPLPPSKSELVPSHAEAVDRAAAVLESSPVFGLVGPDRRSMAAVLGQLSERLGAPAYVLPVDAIPPQGAELETLCRLWQREAHLSPLLLIVDAHQAEPTSAAAALDRLLAHPLGLVAVESREAWRSSARTVDLIEVQRPTGSEQKALWTAALHAADPELRRADAAVPMRLANHFNLDAYTIAEVAKAYGDGTGDGAERLWERCLARTRPALDQLAQRVTPRVGWNDLILPDAEKEQLAQLISQVELRSIVYDDLGFGLRSTRGLGIAALFAGSSGTGKTMAAEVIAAKLNLLLYRIDLAGVMSKYIGETERNLRALFDAAEDGGAILFFDEADALFGKRSEVRDSHDRYANIEINYLLQRIEAFRGLAILATNMKSALDEAFMRRLRFVVNFPFPGVEQRAAMWRLAFPKETRTVGLDYQRLAKFNLTGGSIRNVALNATFLAAARSGGVVSMPLLFEAARAEFRKLERPINEADFRWAEPVGLVR